jgi:hypothetical protein
MSSYGQTLLKSYLDGLLGEEIIEDYRPPWLFGMEIDLFIPSMNLAFEFNGDQHYLHTSFGSPYAQMKRDSSKRRIVKGAGIKLVVIEAADLMCHRIKMKIKNALGKRPKYKAKKMTRLDKASADYRAILIAKYGSPTCRRKGSSIRKTSAKAMDDKFKTL